jgi:multicomponent Na+:H+ antiporter subunit E
VHYAISLSIILYLFWIGLSGFFTPLLLGLGVFSTLLIVWLMARAQVIDGEGHPIRLLLGALWYWPWLLWQILRSGIDVSRLIVMPSLPISPTLVRVRASQRTSAGLATYANSITLTPGTVSVEIDSGMILVHAITEAGAEDVESNTMDRLVSRFEGRAG